MLYSTQILLHVGVCALTYRLADSVFGQRSASIAALFAAVHPTMVTLNFQAMSELLFLFLLLLSVSQTIRVLGPGVRHRAFHAFAAGALLGFSILARPAGLYLPVMIAAYLFVAGAWSRGWPRAAHLALVYLLGATAVVTPWVVRNQVVFDLPKLTTNDTLVLVYFTGAGAYQVHHGVECDAAQRMIAQEFHLRPPEDMWNYHNLDTGGEFYPLLTRPVAARRIASSGSAPTPSLPTTH